MLHRTASTALSKIHPISVISGSTIGLPQSPLSEQPLQYEATWFSQLTYVKVNDQIDRQCSRRLHPATIGKASHYSAAAQRQSAARQPAYVLDRPPCLPPGWRAVVRYGETSGARLDGCLKHTEVSVQLRPLWRSVPVRLNLLSPCT